MTGAEIVAVAGVVEQGVILIAKIVEIIQAAQKGELTADEGHKRLDELTSAYSKARGEARSYVDELFDK